MHITANTNSICLGSDTHFYPKGPVCVCVMCVCYPAVVVQQTSGDDGVEEDLVGGYDVIQVLSPLHFVPKLVPGTFQHLDKRNQSMTKHIRIG